MSLIKHTFSGAGRHREAVNMARHVRVMEADGPVDLRMQAVSGEVYTADQVDPGVGVQLDEPIQEVTLVSGQAQTVEVRAWPGTVYDNRRTGQVVTVTKAQDLNTPADQTVNGGTSAEVLAANTDRREALVVSDPGNTDPVRVGGSGVGSSAGVRLDPGVSITLETTAAVHVFAVSSQATIQALEVID